MVRDVAGSIFLHNNFRGDGYNLNHRKFLKHKNEVITGIGDDCDYGTGDQQEPFRGAERRFVLTAVKNGDQDCQNDHRDGVDQGGGDRSGPGTGDQKEKIPGKE